MTCPEYVFENRVYGQRSIKPVDTMPAWRLIEQLEQTVKCQSDCRKHRQATFVVSGKEKQLQQQGWMGKDCWIEGGAREVDAVKRFPVCRSTTLKRF